MRLKSKLYLLMPVLCLGLAFTGCSDDEPNYKRTDPPTPTDPVTPVTPTTPTISATIQNATAFVKQVASEIYLWSDQTASAINNKLNPETCEDPIKTWEEIRYKNGDIQDKWSMVTDDYASFYNSTQNIEVTYGWDVSFYYLPNSNKKKVYFKVNFVYENSPAANAGIKRGDWVLTHNGRDITPSNFQDIYYSPNGTFGYSHGSVDPTDTADLTAIEMYENPILVQKVFDINGKKVGYIHYTGFDEKSIEPLKAISKEYKEAGVSELILDLRYNGGGLVKTEETMAAMYGPWADKNTMTIYQQDVYNKKYNEAWADSRFHYLNVDDNGENYIDQTYNIGLQKIYAIVSSGTASASESILVGLMPYVPIEIIGSENTHGKYCTGWVLSAPMWYEQLLTEKRSTPEGISNWGFYVMVSRYADKDGNCPIMPNGFAPTIQAKDNPDDGYQLGDARETMLAAALQAAGYAGTRAITANNSPLLGQKFEKQIRPRNFGLRIDNRLIDKLTKNKIEE